MREKWTERTFPTGLPAERLPCLIERLRGTPVRIEEKVRDVPSTILCQRVSKTWSAQENIGHLEDVETLHLARLDDFEAGSQVLRGADMTNQATWDADHNARPLDQVLAGFRAIRARLVSRLEAWEPTRLEITALHPRLRVPMSVADLAHFVAEHDDYHLARVHELLAMLTGKAG